ncbi:MAG: hypothetical protein L3J37_10235 [Rhodobacteraceae bacterium]|nr:hypothetical protein [Paracoccaceae bacterium]
MSITKIALVFASVGFLSACEEALGPNAGLDPANGIVGTRPSPSGHVDAALVRAPALIGKLDTASMAGSALTYAYFTDVIGEIAVLDGADSYCGGAGKANLNAAGAGLVRGVKEGRGYNTMTFACR